MNITIMKLKTQQIRKSVHSVKQLKDKSLKDGFNRRLNKAEDKIKLEDSKKTLLRVQHGGTDRKCRERG